MGCAGPLQRGRFCGVLCTLTGAAHYRDDVLVGYLAGIGGQLHHGHDALAQPLVVDPKTRLSATPGWALSACSTSSG